MIGAGRYFPNRYFAPRYWPKVGDVIVPTNPKYPGAGTFTYAGLSGTLTYAGPTATFERKQ